MQSSSPPVSLLLAVVAATLHVATAAYMFSLARAPGWERLRSFAAVAVSASVYSLTNVAAQLGLQHPAGLGFVLRAQLVTASVHAAAWLLYTDAAADGDWRAVEPAWQRGIIAMIVFTAAIAWFAPVGRLPVEEFDVPSIGATVRVLQMTGWGTLASIPSFAALLLVFARYVRAWRRGEQGAGWVTVGFVVFFLCSLEEALVAAGAVRFLFLADLGFLAILIPVAARTVRRIQRDAARLVELSSALTDTVERRTAERDEAQARLVEEQRLAAVGRLAAGVGHEVNNPLTYVSANLELLQDELAADPRPGVHQALAHATDGVQRIRDVVSGLRSAAAPAAAHQSPIDLREVARDALRVARAGVRHDAGARVSMHLEAGPDAVRVLGDAGRLVQVGVNLIVNAVQAAADHAGTQQPSVRITVVAGDRTCELRVEDSGPGFDPDVVARLGEPYLTTRASRGGSGLGLFVSRGIVDAHAGVLRVDRSSLGGACVRMQLPAVPVYGDAAGSGGTAPSSNGSSSEARAPHVRRVLIVDDEALVVSGLMRALERRGIQATGFTSATDALAEVRREDDFDAVVTDLMMPEMSGPEFAGALASLSPSLRATLVVITGGAMTDDARAFLRRDDVEVVYKPVQLDALLDGLERAARRRRSVRA